MPESLPVDFTDELVALAKLVVLSLLLERGLVVIFDYRWYEELLSGKGLKVPITLTVAWAICYSFQFDVLRYLFETAQPTPVGIFVTSAVAAGGSAGAVKLFQGVLGFSKGDQGFQKELKKLQADTALEKASSEKAEAEANKAEQESRRDKIKAEAEAAIAEQKARKAEAEASGAHHDVRKAKAEVSKAEAEEKNR